jgi:iron complex transport system permease protein
MTSAASSDGAALATRALAAAPAPVRVPLRTSAAQRRARLLFALLAGALLASLVTACCLGAYRIPLAALRAIALGDDSPELAQARAVLLQIRLPRVALALMVGAGFGAAGSALQALFRNPLADPGLIGISSGAALGAALAIVALPTLGLAGGLTPAGVTMLGAFVGALAISALVYRLAARRGQVSLALLLLAGIAINALAGAAIGALTYIATDAQLRSLTFWSLGSLAGAQWQTVAIVLPPVLVGVALIAHARRALDALQLGEAEAFYLGVAVLRVKRVVLGAAALAVAALVSCSGQIGFIGLVAPHCVRLACGPDQRVVLPGAVLLGATLTVLADLVSRTAAAPAEIPLGILTALLGAPFFLALLLRRRGAADA